MKISKKFKDIFYILNDDKQSINLMINNLQQLHDKNMIDVEILLNIIKAMIFLISIDKNKLYDYIKIFNYFLKLNDKNILNNFKIVNFSKQFKVDENKINKIILNTDYIINNSNNIEYKYIIQFIYNITKKIVRLKTSVNNKITIYNIFLDDVIFDINTKNLNYHNMKFNELINNINKFLK